MTKNTTALLSKKDIDKALKMLHLEWKLTPKATQVSATFLFENYLEAFMFVARVSVHAEIIKHHPDIELTYGKVKLKITTHEAKGLTKLDFDLARRVEAAYAKVLAKREGGGEKMKS